MTNSSPWLSHGPNRNRWFTVLNSMVDLSSSLTVSHNQMVLQIDPNITESSKWIRICTPYFICLVVSTLPLWKMMEWKSVGCRIVLGFFVASGFGIGFGFLSRYHLPCICNSLDLSFCMILLHFGMVTLHCAWYLLHLAMFASHFEWYLSFFGISTSHLHGICYIFVLQTFMWVSWGFHLGIHLRFHWGFHLGII